jgi:hypothetical protein
MSEELTFSTGAVEQLSARMTGLVKGAVELAAQQARPDSGLPASWWRLYLYGPIAANRLNDALQPTRAIVLGETLCIFTIIWLNPWPVLADGPSASDLITSLGSAVEIRYSGHSLQPFGEGPPSMQASHTVALTPGRNWYCDSLCFDARDEGLFEVNVTARVRGQVPSGPSRLAGTAITAAAIAPDLFRKAEAPESAHLAPLRFLVHS